MKDKRNLRSLEVGCGRAAMSLYFAKRNNFKTVLLDCDKNALFLAKSFFKKHRLKYKAILGNAEHLSFKNNSFDVVFSTGLLEHFDNPEKPLKEMCRVLKRGGLFFHIIVPRKIFKYQSLATPFNLIYKFFLKSNERETKFAYYRNSLKPEDYSRIMEDLNLNNIKIIGIEPIAIFFYLPAFLERIIIFFDSLYLGMRGGFMKEPWITNLLFSNKFIIFAQKK